MKNTIIHNFSLLTSGLLGDSSLENQLENSVIPEGTSLAIEIDRSLTFSSIKQGAMFGGRVVFDVIIGNKTIISSGTKVMGQIFVNTKLWCREKSNEITMALIKVQKDNGFLDVDSKAITFISQQGLETKSDCADDKPGRRLFSFLKKENINNTVSVSLSDYNGGFLLPKGYNLQFELNTLKY